MTLNDNYFYQSMVDWATDTLAHWIKTAQAGGYKPDLTKLNHLVEEQNKF